MAVKTVAINKSASGENSLVAAQEKFGYVVTGYVVVADGAVEVKFKNGAGGSDVTGPMSLAANGIVSSGYNPDGHFKVDPNKALILNLSSAVEVNGHLTYREVGNG
jgi:hypothetical protein